MSLYEVNRIGDTPPQYAVVPYYRSSDDDAAIVRECRTKDGIYYWYCMRCAPVHGTPCPHMQAVTDHVQGITENQG